MNIRDFIHIVRRNFCLFIRNPYFVVRNRYRYYKAHRHNEIRGLKFYHEIMITGSGNSIDVSSGLSDECSIHIQGNNNVIRIERNCYFLKGVHLGIKGENLHLHIAEKSTFRTNFSAQAQGASIEIGQNCMISERLFITTTDFHPIFSLETGNRLNVPKDVIIGDNVWVGIDSTILKGSIIGSGSVIGAKSLVAGKIPDNAIACGVPAKVIKNNIRWERYGDLNNI